MIYTKDEEETFEFFSLSISTPLTNQGKYLTEYGTKFEGGCPFCGRGKKLVGDAYINRNFVKKYDFAALDHGFVFLSKYVKTLIEENSFTGIKFPARLLDYKGREIPEYYCPEFENILPPMSEKTWVYTDDFLKRYDICGHHPRFLRSSVKYTRTALKDAMDFNLSKEYFNCMQNQEIIISKRVRDLFKKQKIRAWPLPVQIVD